MDLSEALQRLQSIEDICKRTLTSGRPMMTHEWDLLQQVKSIASANDEPVVRISNQIPQQVLDHVILSCDASITKNPGGRVAIGVTIEYKNEPPIQIGRVVPNSTTNNQGEYDAVYYGLTQLMDLKNNPACLVEVHSDSKLVVDQLNKTMQCKDSTLQRKRDIILELVEHLPVPVSFHWKPRNSTTGLEEANFIFLYMLERED
jgi:ribonuclease HI